MTRKLKALGLAVVAVLAMSAVVAASGAQAAAPEFHCTATVQTNCTVSGTSALGKLIVSNGNVTCTSSAYSSTIAKTVTSATVNATYTGCKAFGVKAVVKMNECDYVFNAVAGSSPATAKVDVKCPAGNKIEIIASSLPCTVTVGEQAGLEHVVFTNTGTEPTSVSASVTVSNIAVTKIGAGCPEGAGATTGSLTDTVVLSGFEDPGGTKVGLHVF